MAAPMHNILVVGFGAMGAIYSMILQKSGLAHVTAVARSNYDDVMSHGIQFKSRRYGDIPAWRPGRLCRSVSEAADQPYSYVVVATKAIPELIRTDTLLYPLLSPPYSDKFPQPTYVLFQNGLNVEVDLYNALKKLGKGEPQIIGSAIYVGTNMTDDNVVEHDDEDRVSLGFYRPDCTITTNSTSELAILTEFCNMLEKGGSSVTIVPEIQRVKFSKNLWNISFSSIATLVGYRLPAFFRSPPKDGEDYELYISDTTRSLVDEYTIPNIRAVLEEVLSLARALGFPDSESGIPSSVVDSNLNYTAALHVIPGSIHAPSMLLDATRGKPIEVEVIVGEVVRMAKEKGVALPRVEMLYALLVVVQNQILRKLEVTKK